MSHQDALNILMALKSANVSGLGATCDLLERLCGPHSSHVGSSGIHQYHSHFNRLGEAVTRLRNREVDPTDELERVIQELTIQACLAEDQLRHERQQKNWCSILNDESIEVPKMPQLSTDFRLKLDQLGFTILYLPAISELSQDSTYRPPHFGGSDSDYGLHDIQPGWVAFETVIGGKRDRLLTDVNHSILNLDERLVSYFQLEHLRGLMAKHLGLELEKVHVPTAEEWALAHSFAAAHWSLCPVSELAQVYEWCRNPWLESSELAAFIDPRSEPVEVNTYPTNAIAYFRLMIDLQ